MEKDINEIAKDALSHPKVSGYLCSDHNGLCLAVSGCANEKNSGIFASIAHLANKLESGKSPVIYIESEKSKILIQCKDSITTALYKTP